MIEKKQLGSSLTEEQKQELDEFQRRLKQIQNKSTNSQNGIQSFSSQRKNESIQSYTPSGSSKMNLYKGRNNSCIDSNLNNQSPQNIDKVGLESTKSPWSILKLENTGSNFNNTAKMNTYSLTGDNHMTPKDFDEQLYIKRVQQYNQQSNINAEQLLQKMQEQTESNLLIRHSSKKNFNNDEGIINQEIDQTQQSYLQDQINQINTGANSFLNTSTKNPNAAANSQNKGRIQVKSIRMFETENSIMYPKKLNISNIDQSFQRKHNFSFDKIDGQSTGGLENGNNNQLAAQKQNYSEADKYLQSYQLTSNNINNQKIEFSRQQSDQKRNIDNLSSENTPDRINPLLMMNQNFKDYNQNPNSSFQYNNQKNNGGDSLLERQSPYQEQQTNDKKQNIQRYSLNNKQQVENNKQEDDPMITSSSSSGLKKVQFQVDAAINALGAEKSLQSDLKMLLQNKKNQTDTHTQIQQQFRNNQTLGTGLSSQNRNTESSLMHYNNRSNSSYVSTQSNMNNLSNMNNINNNQLTTFLLAEKANSGSLSRFNNSNENNKQLIDALSNLKNEYRRNFYSKQIDNVLEEKVRQHQSKENSREKLYAEAQAAIKNELTKRPLTTKLIQFNLQRKNSSKNSQQLNKSLRNESVQVLNDSKMNHVGSESIADQNAFSIAQKDGNQYNSKENNNTSNLHFRKLSQNNPCLVNSNLRIHNESKTLNESQLKGSILNNITFSKIQSPKNMLDVSSPKEVGSALNKNINLQNAKDVQFLYNLIKDHIQKCPSFCKEISKCLEQ